MSNNGLIVKVVLHIAIATVLALVATRTMGSIGIQHFAGTISLHGYSFDLAALVVSHLVVGKIFFS